MSDNPSQLEILDISRNQLRGSLPLFVCNLTLLQSLDLSNNNLCGRVPQLFSCNPTSLQYLDLSNNKLYGRLPQWLGKSSCAVLLFLSLSNNSLSGHIPDTFGSLTHLRSLHLESGGIPWPLKHCRSLVTLDLSENNLSGNIPQWIGESLSSLTVLSLRSNSFTGNIPLQLSYPSNLQVLDLSNNNLMGTLTLSFQNLSAMTKTHNPNRIMSYNIPDISTFYYTDSLQLTTKGSVSYYTSLLSAVTCIDLSSNNLYGQIPDGLMKLVGLVFLNLSRNQLTGMIPQNIGSLAQLESLDLSVNKLSGKISPSMSRLNFLSHLNLSINNLCGTIPQGNQFSTFYPSIYIGNHDLCGWPLPKCSGSGNEPSNSLPRTNIQEGEEHNNLSEIALIYASAALGFVVSFWAFIGTIMIKQSIRSAYFRSIDQLQDLIHEKFAVNIARGKSTAKPFNFCLHGSKMELTMIM